MFRQEVAGDRRDEEVQHRRTEARDVSELRQHRLRSQCCRLQQPKQARLEAESSGPEKERERVIFLDSQRDQVSRS